MQSEEKETGSLGIDKRDVTIGEAQETRLMTGLHQKPHEAVFEKNEAKSHFFLDKGKIWVILTTTDVV